MRPANRCGRGAIWLAAALFLCSQASGAQQQPPARITTAIDVLEVPAGCNASHRCTSQTIVADQVKNGLSYPEDLVVAASGNLYITQPTTTK